MPHKIEWHYDEPPPVPYWILVAHILTYSGTRNELTTSPAIYDPVDKVYRYLHDETEITGVYAWAYLPDAPPTKP